MGGRCIYLPREICMSQWTEGEAHPEGATADRDIMQDQQKSAAAVVLLPKKAGRAKRQKPWSRL